MRKTKFGRNIYITGGNIKAAQLSGIPILFYKFIPFVIMGLCAAISGLMYCSRIYAGSATYGTDLAIYSVAAAVIGGTSLSGGSGGVAKTLVGLLVMSILFNAMTLLGVEGYFQQLVRGIVLITVIVMDAFINRRKNR
jgi:ribose/xylose/arabinose/galactoside ABC-type transport system permease subunit